VPIHKILVANRSEIAIRVFRAANELGMKTVAVFAEEDKLALHRFKADEAYQIGKGLGPIQAYLSIPDIIRVAREARADAIHPGYGFLSENPDFAAACAASGITFIGPSPQTMRRLGDKIAARNLAVSVGVPVMPASEPLPTDMKEVRHAASAIGYPVMLKASWGGGGRGMRVIPDRETLAREGKINILFQATLEPDRRLKNVPVGTDLARSEQDRLDRMIVVAVMKSGEKYAAQGKLVEAAEFFLRVPREYPRDPKAPQALHNAATIFERGKKPEEAVSAYKELAEKYPQAPEASEALFTAAHIEESVASYDRAALLYEQVVIRFPKSKHGAEALRNAGVLRQTLGENEKAIQHFGDYARRYKDHGDAKELAFQVAVVRERQQDWKSAAQSFDDYARTHPGDGRNVEALTRAGDAQLKAGSDGKARDTLARALALAGASSRGRKVGGGGGGGAGGGSGDSRYWAAQARYLQGELIFRDYEKLKIAGKPKQLAKVLDDKAKLLEQAKHVYLDVVTYQSPEWATAALLRIGQGYEAFAKAMRQAPVPKDLSADEKQVYRDELEKLTVVIEDKAIDAYKSGYGKALEIGVYNQHTQNIRQALTRLDEGSYPKELEWRAGLRAGEPPLRIGKLEEVRRDK